MGFHASDDEHSEPMGQEQDGPDWDRYVGVSSRASEQNDANFTADGDPTRWGGEGVANLPDATAQATPNTYHTKQLLYVQTKDPYPRNWQIVGSVLAVPEFWAAVDAAPSVVQLVLDVTLGVGQINVRQWFNLGALLAFAAPWYIPIHEGGGDQNHLESRSFVISGGLVGHYLSAKGIVGLDAAATEGPTGVQFQAVISPFASRGGF